MTVAEIFEKIKSIPYAMDVLSWLSYGLAASLTAKIILPGQENIGWIKTVAVGLLGAFIGGLLANYLGYNLTLGWNFAGFLAAVAGSLVCLLLNRLVTKT